MRAKCEYCGSTTGIPCRNLKSVEFYGTDEPGNPAVARCKGALEKLNATKPAEHPAEDTFTLPGDRVPQNGHPSDTAKAQMAMADLSRYAAPSPFEWERMRGGSVAVAAALSIPEHGVRSAKLRPADAREEQIERKRRQLEAAGERVEWTGDYPSAAKTEGVKFDTGKLRFDLIPPDALALLAAVMTYGSMKYADRNWELGMDRARLRAARARHENARLLGQPVDPETGLPHLAHEAACTMMELALTLRGVGTDSAAVIGAVQPTVEALSAQAVEAGRVAAAKREAHRG